MTDAVTWHGLDPITNPARALVLLGALAGVDGVLTVEQLLGLIEKGDIEDLLAAADIPFDGMTSGLTAEHVQAAIDALAARKPLAQIATDERGDSYTLLEADAGRLQSLSINGARTFTLPAIADVEAGALFWVRNGGSSTLTVARAGPDVILAPGAGVVSSVELEPYEAVAIGEVAGGWALLTRAKASSNGLVPTGAVGWFAGAAAPSGWLKANGALVSRTTYGALFSAIGTTYGAGDGSTTFALPDLRGEFVRGWDDGRGIDGGRVRGSAQADAIREGTFPALSAGSNPTGSVSLVSTYLGIVPTGSALNDRVFRIGTAGVTETRPRNVALLACIKF